MREPSDNAARLQRALARTRSILDGLEDGDIRATQLPALLEDRRSMFPAVDDLGELTPTEVSLAQEIQSLDRKILTWCERAVIETREQMARARRAARPTPPPTARLVSESA